MLGRNAYFVVQTLNVSKNQQSTSTELIEMPVFRSQEFLEENSNEGKIVVGMEYVLRNLDEFLFPARSGRKKVKEY